VHPRFPSLEEPCPVPRQPITEGICLIESRNIFRILEIF
jgi:hypothetical protein